MSQELEEIVIENFGTIEHIKLVLNTPGMILITGLNKDAPKADSNGAGKSLLLDAICWCLWGKTVRGLTADDVVRRQIGKDCCVSLKIKDEKNSYIITRHRKDTRVDKPNDLRLFINGVEKGKKMKNLQEIIDTIVGFDFDTFCAMMPGAGVSAASLTDTGIKELLEKLLQTEQLSHAYTAAHDRLKVLNAELKVQETLYTNILGQLVSLEREVKQLRDLEQSFVAKKAANVASRQQRIAELDAELAACSEIADTYDERANTVTKIKNEIANLQQQVLLIENPAKAKLKLYQAEIQQHENTIRLLNHDKKTHEDKILSFSGLGATCPTCNTTVTPEHVASCTALIQAEISVLDAKRVPLEAFVRATRDKVNSLTASTALDIHAVQSEIDIKNLSLEMAQQALVLCKAQIQLKNRLETDRSREQEGLKLAQSETHNFTEIFATKVAKVQELVQALCQSLTTKRQLEKEHKLCSFWVDGFSPAGLRSYMLDYVTPVLNDRAAYYSDVLTGGEMKVTFTTKTALKNGTEKDKFQIMVEQKHGGDLYKATSKGEKARADLVIAMALGDLATFRTAKQLPWRFLDEPFENIDDAGNEAVVQLLNDQKSRYKTVFVVTHKPAFKKLFNQRIAVVKENGISRLEHE